MKKDEERVIVSDIEKDGYKKSITYFKKIKEYDKYTLLEAEQRGLWEASEDRREGLREVAMSLEEDLEGYYDET